MSIEQTRSIETPQRAYEWEVEIAGPATIGGIDNLFAYAQTASLPEESIDTIEINHKSEKTMHAGRVASGRTFTINFFDDENLTVYRHMKNWLETIKSSQTGGGVDRTLYGADVIVRQLESDSETVAAEHTYRLAFPTTIGEVSLSYDSSEVMTFDITFAYQRHVLV